MFTMVDGTVHSLYELFGVRPDCTFEELRDAYRQRAREVHPDVADSTVAPGAMARINEAWQILSDPDQRQQYDLRTSVQRSPQPNTQRWPHAPRTPQATKPVDSHTQIWRQQTWTSGVQGQILRISSLAGRSATQALLMRKPRAGRADYDKIAKQLVSDLCEETESRMRAARAAGAPPLDLAVATTLIGIRTLADRLRRDAALEITVELLMAAELLDRMWDVLAHELPNTLATALGGNPQVSRLIESGRFA